MKNFLLVLAIIICAFAVNAQNHDLSAYAQTSADGSAKYIPWYVFSDNNVVIEGRYNFDWPDAPTLLVGKNLSVGHVALVPSVGYIAGDYGGPTGQLNLIYSGRIHIFSLNQVALGKGNPNFLYQYIQLRYQLSELVSVGIDEEVYKEEGSPSSFDAGPAIKVGRKFYITVTPMFNGGYKKTLVGIGHTF